MAESTSAKSPRKKGDVWFWVRQIGCAFFTLFFISVIFIASFATHSGPRHNVLMMKARAIGLALFQYALSPNHGGSFPDGKTSTEVFQKLIDDGDLTDPKILYVPMPGKTPATSNHLKPENVCWDVTGGVMTNDDDDLPLVFLTGYKVIYQPGVEAIPLTDAAKSLGGIPVCWKGMNAAFLRMSDTISQEYFILKTFNAQGKTYRQLTP